AAAPAAGPSERDLYFAAAAAAREGEGAGSPASPVIFDPGQDGAWTLSNGSVTLRGRSGSDRLVDEIVLDAAAGGDARSVGSLGALLQWRGPSGNVWTSVALQDVFAASGPDGAVSLEIRAVARGAVPGPVPGVAAPDASFALVARVSLAPGTGSFLAEIVSLENTGASGLEFSVLYFTPAPAGADQKVVDVVPELRGAPARAWWCLPDGREWGAVSRDPAASFRFWLRPADGTLHPDARFSAGPAPVTLAPGAVWRPASAMGACIGFRPAVLVH
ncbi:MAG: hypothetical protein IJ678_04950, partial [Kiritimatiellae bacterium]|nr:hypothetical protein [Kiritimatiellia bacterium]